LPSPPKISIITVTYQAVKVLESTIESILNQSFTDYEYILIDGASTDGTLDIIKKYAHHISYYVSEKDSGLYDAMNKGLKVAKGEYVWFMNAGDEIYDPNTLANIFDTKEQPADIYYGDALFVSQKKEVIGLRSQVTPHKLPQNLTWRSLRYGMVVCHQSFIARTSLAPAYDLSHPYCADIDWELACLKKAKKVVNTHMVLSKYLTGGFSKQNLQASLWDRYLVLKDHYGFFNTLVSHMYITLRAILFRIRKCNGF
jgi:glycosyltransferase involved in cell wall biosynthesis